MLRTAARRDTNEQEIIKALRGAGASVEQISRKGFPDLVVGVYGKTFLLEVKTEDGELTDDQRNFLYKWKGHYAVVRCVDDALDVVFNRQRRMYRDATEHMSVDEYKNEMLRCRAGGGK